MADYCRIHIFGPSGSGKSTLADLLARRTGFPVFDLDDLFWMNEKGQFGRKRPVPQRDGGLADILATVPRITEGIYTGWAMPFFEAADFILFLDSPRPKRFASLLWRHMGRKTEPAAARWSAVAPRSAERSAPAHRSAERSAAAPGGQGRSTDKGGTDAWKPPEPVWALFVVCLLDFWRARRLRSVYAELAARGQACARASSVEEARALLLERLGYTR